MSVTKNSGCGLWALLVIIVSALFGFSSNQIVTDTPPPTLTPTFTPSFVATIYPQETDAYFVVENSEISYSYHPTLDWPCNYIIEGRVFDINGQPYTNLVVNIQMIGLEEGVKPPDPSHRFPGGNGNEAGEGYWEALLPSWSVNYIVWLTTEIGGEELSPHIIVSTRDCDQNKAEVNFVQVRPLP